MTIEFRFADGRMRKFADLHPTGTVTDCTAINKGIHLCSGKTIRPRSHWRPSSCLSCLASSAPIIGIQLLVSLGVTPNTSIIGALVAMIIARVPLNMFATYRSIHVQNLAQSNILAATFGAANSLLLPTAIPFLMGRPDLVLPMFIGVTLAMLFGGWLLYRMFDTKVFPASGAWPPGVAAAEAIKAGDSGGVQARLLGVGIAVDAAGSWFGIPMSAFGVAFIGNVWALVMLGIGFLIRGYAQPVTGIDIAALYIPQGFVEGHNLAIEFRWARGDYERLTALAAELVALPVAVLAALGGESSGAAAKQATSTIPVVFGVGGDPVESGLVESFARPGGNLTGYTLLTNQMEAKRVGLLHELVPSVGVFGALINPHFSPIAQQLQQIENATAGAGGASICRKCQQRCRAG